MMRNKAALGLQYVRSFILLVLMVRDMEQTSSLQARIGVTNLDTFLASLLTSI